MCHSTTKHSLPRRPPTEHTASQNHHHHHHGPLTPRTNNATRNHHHYVPAQPRTTTTTNGHHHNAPPPQRTATKTHRHHHELPIPRTTTTHRHHESFPEHLRDGSVPQYHQALPWYQCQALPTAPAQDRAHCLEEPPPPRNAATTIPVICILCIVSFQMREGRVHSRYSWFESITCCGKCEEGWDS